MTDDLPNEFDLIVLGTGLTEAIVAAAATRIGKTVLHLDTNEYYGGYWASFNVKSFGTFLESSKPSESESERSDRLFVEIQQNPTAVSNASERWYNYDELGDVDGWNRKRILAESFKFNIDLAPKVLYSRGAMVELLISSNICRYLEFRAFDRVMTIWNERILTVPCSRSDVFTSKEVYVVEKRLLMKFLQGCASYEPGSDGGEHKQEDIEGKTFLEYLKSHKLTPNLIHFLLYTISMGNEGTSCRDGLESVKKFLRSSGHYGNSPFVFPVYGCGDIPQSFCRQCAVFGGVYCLTKTVDGIELKEEDGKLRFASVKYGKQNIKSNNLVIGPGYVSKGCFALGNSEGKPKSCGKLARAVILTNVPFGGVSQNPGGGGVSIMKLPPVAGHKEGATILQMSHYSSTCPKDIYLIHMITVAVTESPEHDLKPYVDQLLSRDYNRQPTVGENTAEESIETPPQENTTSTILYEAYFNIPACIGCENDSTKSTEWPAGIWQTCGPYNELDYDVTIAQAKRLFNTIFPDEEFLPSAPDPDQIIFGGEDQEESEKTITSVDQDDTADVSDMRDVQESIESVKLTDAKPVQPEAELESVDRT